MAHYFRKQHHMCVRVCVCALLGNTSEKFVRIFYEYLNAKTQMDIHKKWGGGRWEVRATKLKIHANFSHKHSLPPKRRDFPR